MKKIIFIAILSVIITACGSYRSLDLNKLTTGMTKEQVTELIGPPNRILSVNDKEDGYQEVLEYRTNRDEVYALEFWNDYLTGYEFLYDDVKYVAPYNPPMIWPDYGRPIYVMPTPNRPVPPNRPPAQPVRPSQPSRPPVQSDRPNQSTRPSEPTTRPSAGTQRPTTLPAISNNRGDTQSSSNSNSSRSSTGTRQ